MPLLIGTGRSLLYNPPAIVASSNSVWGDHGTNITLSTTSLANDTAANGNANSFASVRGTQAYSTGKRYVEFKILTAPAVANFIIGMMDDTTANGAAMDDRLLNNSAAHLQFNGSQQNGNWAGTDLGALWSLVDNDYMGIAADFTNEFYYLSLNGTYFLSGDPTSGATGTGAVGNGARPNARPMLTLWGATTAFSGIVQLITGSNITAGHIPSGYTAWA